MIKARGKRFFWCCLLAFVGVVSWSAAWGDFYVIPVGMKAKRTVLVSPKSTTVESGTALLAALDAISDASSTNPYLMIIEPGVYDIGSSTFRMKSYVDVQGSGENVTKITGAVSTIPPTPEVGVVEGADNAELRFLTVENRGTSTTVIAILNNGTSPTMSFVTASVTGGYYRKGIANKGSSATLRNVNVQIDHTGASGIGFGVRNEDSPNVTMENVTINLTGTARNLGVDNEDSTTMMRCVNVTVSGGTNSIALQNYYGSAETYVEHSVLSGPYWIYNNGHVYVANSRIEGGLYYNNNVITCAGVFDETYTFYASSCPP